MDTDVEYIDLNNLKLIPTDLNKESQKSEGKSNKFHKIYFQISTNTKKSWYGQGVDRAGGRRLREEEGERLES